MIGRIKVTHARHIFQYIVGYEPASTLMRSLCCIHIATKEMLRPKSRDSICDCKSCLRIAAQIAKDAAALTEDKE